MFNLLGMKADSNIPGSDSYEQRRSRSHGMFSSKSQNSNKVFLLPLGAAAAEVTMKD